MSDSDSTTPLKVCTKCGRSLPATREFFHYHSQLSSGLQPACKDCRRAAARRWQHANKERHAATNRAWQRANLDKCREANRKCYRANPKKKLAAVHAYQARKSGNGGTHTQTDVQTQYKRQKARCFYCHKPLGEQYDIDHVVPLALGGSNGPENLVVACPLCNGRKHAKHPMDFAGILF